MDKTARIYVAGHRGLVGSAIVRHLKSQGYNNLLLRSHAELELTDPNAVRGFFEREQPEYVFVAAARVGGIVANETFPAEFIHENVMIAANIAHEAWRAKCRRMLYLGSSCIYPRDCPQPIRESYFLTGPLEQTNRAYATAKIAGVEMCWSYNRQCGTRYIAAMPTNLFGRGDNYDLKTSHVLPALIRKFHEAKVGGIGEVEIWGTGTPRREFLYSDDAADACVFLMNLPQDKVDKLCGSRDEPPLINIGCGEDQTIKAIAEMVAGVVGFTGKLRFDASKPDGTPRKQLDVSRLSALGWRPKVPLAEGLKLAYRQFLEK